MLLNLVYMLQSGIGDVGGCQPQHTSNFWMMTGCREYRHETLITYGVVGVYNHVERNFCSG
jgi:hypothetical protein